MWAYTFMGVSCSTDNYVMSCSTDSPMECSTAMPLSFGKKYVAKDVYPYIPKPVEYCKYCGSEWHSATFRKGTCQACGAPKEKR